MSLHSIQLIVGLANPGKEYSETRHNAGAWLIENLASLAANHLKHNAKFHGLHAAVNTNQMTYHLLIPTTFMNHSGQSVQACMNYYNIAASSILIAHDDIDLPVGAIKLKFDGGDGGHNGLKDIIRHLHSKQFYRCRIGVGRPTQHQDVVQYVLSQPSRLDRQKIQETLVRIPDLLTLILNGHMQQAMQLLHTET